MADWQRGSQGMFGHCARWKRTCPSTGGAEEEAVRACPEDWGREMGQRGCQLHKGKGQRTLTLVPGKEDP